MTSLVRQAALNNASLCSKVLAAHGITSTLTDTHWRAHAAPIPLYPGLVTLAPIAVLPSPVFGGIKDSFNDLAPDGYTLGIEGHWWLAPRTTPAKSSLPRSTPAAATTDLDRWLHLWSGTDTATTFPASLLDDPDLVFARSGDSGGLLNSGGGVVGISNTYGPGPLLPLAALAQIRWPGTPVVLWHDRADITALTATRFRRLASMRVWFPLANG